MLSVAVTATISGVDGLLVRVEAHSAAGTPAFSVIGLPDRSIGEARERVKAAILNAGLLFPAGRVLVNLAPADVRKEGPGFDLAIALALIGIGGDLDHVALASHVVLGELALDGKLRPVRGALAAAMAAREAGIQRMIVAPANAGEATLVDGLDVFAAGSLLDALAVLQGHGSRYRAAPAPEPPPNARHLAGDFSDVRGQHAAKRALEIAAAGGHNVLLVGPPGCGKTMIASRLPTILPAPTPAEALEITKVRSLIGPVRGIVRERNFRSPHHTASKTALVGGGSIPCPGEVSLAHHGVLFLDELPEFSRSTIEVLRQPLESGEVTIARAHSTATFPARFTLVAAMNPCPCGLRGARHGDCRCDDAAVARYLSKLSGPILDRIDLHVEVSRLPFDEMHVRERAESSAAIRARVEAARAVQRKRFGNSLTTNASMNATEVERFCRLDTPSLDLLRAAAAKGVLSARALDRITRIARTIADLAAVERLGTGHIAEAIAYRVLERRGLAA